MGYLSLADYTATLHPGTDTLWIDRGIAKGQQAGTYTFEGLLVYEGRVRSGSSTFTVNGTPISAGLAQALTCKDAVDNLSVEATSAFTPSDEKAVVWTAWAGAWGTHKVKYAWYLPDGAFYFDYTHGFTTSEALYKSWAWIEGVGLWQLGTYQVKVYLDGSLVTTVQFEVQAGGQGAGTQRAPFVVGGGGGEE